MDCIYHRTRGLAQGKPIGAEFIDAQGKSSGPHRDEQCPFSAPTQKLVAILVPLACPVLRRLRAVYVQLPGTSLQRRKPAKYAARTGTSSGAKLTST